MSRPGDYKALVAAIVDTHARAQRQAAQAVNVALTLRNWLVGFHIVEYEQHGKDRARYGERLLAELGRDLSRQLGRGFTRRSLELFRLFVSLRQRQLKSAYSLSAPTFGKLA